MIDILGLNSSRDTTFDSLLELFLQTKLLHAGTTLPLTWHLTLIRLLCEGDRKRDPTFILL